MSDRRRRLSRLMSHWPDLSDRERQWLLVALGLNGLVGMSIQAVALAFFVRASRRSWRARKLGPEAVGRAAGLSSVAGWLAVSQAQQVVARRAFTSYERRLSRRPTSGD